MPYLHSKIKEVIERIGQDVASGYRCLPFIGAGLSVPSGHPMLRHLEDTYLPYCILRALSIHPFATRLAPRHILDLQRHRWVPREGMWPDLSAELVRHWNANVPNSASRLPHKSQATTLLGSIITLCDRSLGQKGQRYIDDFLQITPYSLLLRAHDAVSGDWRTMLRFLSQLTEQRDAQGRRYVAAALPDAAVIDSFFQHIAKHCDPSLGHRMVQALSSLLRFDVVLTTNYDSFIERGFALVNSPIAVFEVPLPAPLPASELVLAQRSLVKLHGGRFGVRADLSVDSPPDERDMLNFFGYLAGRKLQPEESIRGPFYEEVAIIVSGMSGREERTLSLLMQAWKAFPKLRIYWLTTGADPHSVKRLQRMFPRSHVGEHHIDFLPHPDHSLFFAELFQIRSRALPTAGIIFPGMWELPTPPIITPAPHLAHSLNIVRNRIWSAIEHQWKAKNPKPLCVQMKKGSRGGVSACADIFFDAPALRRLSRTAQNNGARALWLDLDQVWKPVGIFLRLTLLTAKANGELDPISSLEVDLFGSSEAFLDAVRSALRSHYARPCRGGDRYLVFLNAQEGCGLDSPICYPLCDLDERLARKRAPRTIEDPTHEWHDRKRVGLMLDLISTLNEDRTCGVQFILILRTTPKATDPRSRATKLERIISGNTLILREELKKRTKQWVVVPVEKDCSTFAPTSIAERAAEKVVPNGTTTFSPEALLLYTLTLFRHARYPASVDRIIAELRDHPQCLPLDTVSHELVSTFLEQWEQAAILRRKPGGFIWMHPALKSIIRAEIERRWSDNGIVGWERIAFHIETLLARWYGRLLLGSSDPLCAVETMFHALHAIERFAIASNTVPASNGATEWPSSVRLYSASVALRHAKQVLSLGAPLFERRLSDRFADHALRNINARITRILILLQSSTGKASTKPLRALRDDLVDLLRSVLDVRGDLFIREGEYRRLIPTRALGKHSTPVEIPNDNYVSSLVHSRAQSNRAFIARRLLRRAAAHIHLRHFSKAEARLAFLWGFLTSKSLLHCSLEDIPRSWRSLGGGEAAREWLESRKRSFGNECEERVLAKLARWSLQFLMHRSQAYYLADAVAQPDATAARERARSEAVKLALWFYRFGIELLRHSNHVSDRFVWEENVRLRAHAALYHLYVDSHNNDNALEQADRILSDAESFVDEFPLRDAGIVRVTIQLRRAEIILMTVGREPSFRKCREQLSHELRKAAREKGFQTTAFSMQLDYGHVRSLAAQIRDAIHSLDSAEAELRRHPKSRWWWWIYAVLKQKCVEYLYTCRLARASTSDINENKGPFDLLSPSVVDFLWGGIATVVITKQMTDAFFLGRIVDSFSRATFAHALYHLNQDSGSSSDRERIAHKLRHLNETLAVLRKQLEIELMRKDTDLDKKVRSFATASSETADSVSTIILNWTEVI